MSRRLTLALAGAATGLLVSAQLVTDRRAGSAVLAIGLLAGALAVGALAIAGAWWRPRAQSSADGSVAGPT